MGKIYLLFYIILVVCAKYIDGIAQILAILFALFFGFLFAVADGNIRLKKQGLKIASFYDAFKKDFNILVLCIKNTPKGIYISVIWTFKTIFKGLICIKNIPKGIYISVIWTFKTIFKGLKWLFKPEHIRLFFFLIKKGIVLLLHGAWLLVYYFFYFIAGIAGIIGLISGIIGFFGLF